MKVKIGSTEYTEIANLTFSPETDITGSAAPINELIVDILTDDQIEVGSAVSLYDDRGILWASYWVTDPVRLDEYTIRVTGQSALMLLDRITLPATMYDRTAVGSILESLLAPVPYHSISPDFSERTISGFAPEQTARERLQWVVFVLGGYIKNYGDGYLRILPIEEEEQAIIPLENTYWKPQVKYRDHVTGIRAKIYTYERREPTTKEHWVEANGVTYVENSRVFELTNPNAPSLAPENWVSVEDVTIINEANVDDVLAHMAAYYFNRAELDLECVNNGEWWPGQRVIAYANDHSIYGGYINSATFTFGVQAKSSLDITAAEQMDGARLEIRYVWDGNVVGKRSYFLPVGYPYSIENPYFQRPMVSHMYVFRPENKKIEGTLPEDGETIDEDVSPVLDLYNGVLTIIGVDEIKVKSQGNYVVGEIS